MVFTLVLTVGGKTHDSLSVVQIQTLVHSAVGFHSVVYTKIYAKRDPEIPVT
jgi:hypothetical protein